MNKSDDIKELAAALCKAQGEMGGANKDAENSFFKSTYADLGSVVRAIKQPFADNGLSYSQLTTSDNGLYGVTTVLMHTSGQWLSSVLLLPVKKPNDPQAAGSAITYARRYALQAMAGIPSEDDDGNAASKAPALSEWYESLGSARPLPDNIWNSLSKEQVDYFNVQMRVGV